MIRPILVIGFGCLEFRGRSTIPHIQSPSRAVISRMIFPTDPFSSCAPALSTTAAILPLLTPAQEAARYDADLVNRFNAGDESAFVEIVCRYRTRMLRVAFDVLKNRADAEEIMQDTFIRAHRALANFRGDSSLATWLRCVTLNLARNRYWYFFRRCRHTTVSIETIPGENNLANLSDVLPSEEISPFRSAMTNEFSELVARCLSQMEVHSREILMMRTSLNRSYGDIARDLSINVGTVKSRISRARAILHDLLAKACPEFGRTASVSTWFEIVRPAA
jgi:RNA polymerase sigma-70 factor (ECF subfamily)